MKVLSMTDTRLQDLEAKLATASTMSSPRIARPRNARRILRIRSTTEHRGQQSSMCPSRHDS